MNIQNILQPSNIYFIPKYENINNTQKSSIINDEIFKTNQNNLNIGRTNPNLELNAQEKIEILNQIVQMGNQQFSNTMHAVYLQSLEDIKNDSSYI